jgi:predicted CXXCH cytochrome family protein
LLNSTSTGNAFCLTCHNGTGAPADPVVSTHSNADETGVEQTFVLECSQCHEPHGSGNLSSVRDYARVDIVAQPEVTSGPIVFTATTGTNSFDDGTSPVASRICVVCHTNPDNPGYPVQSHIGGAGHNGGSSDYTGLDCTSCHPHSTDSDQGTNDGFMPSGCTGCHGTGLGARRQITGTGGDFERASHHVTTTIQDGDCEVCHDASQHTGTPGNPVRLFNADDPGIVYVLDGTDDPGNLELFCLSCHDADGAGGSTPFSDSTTPPPIDNTVWTSASHNTSGNVGSCVDCHDNGHGSNKTNLLAPYNITGDSDPNDPFQQEERFCYNCHDTDGPAVSDIQAQFGYSSHHRIAATEQEVAAIKEVNLECSNCHNPHTVNGSNKLSNPDDLTQFTSNNNNFCLACHDGTPPSGVTFGAYTSSGFGWDKQTYINNTTHFLGDDTIPSIQCQDCHENHGSNANYDPGSNDPTQYADLLKGRYVRVVDQGFYNAGFALCWNCHDANLVVSSNNAWGGEHNSHDDDGPCIWCHDVHAPAQPGEPGLQSFYYANTYGDLLLQYTSKGSDVFTDLHTSYERNGTPQCGITCHNTSHGSKSFTSNPLPDPPGSTP